MSKKKNGGQMTTIQFENDEQRKNFQLKMALNVLEGEVINTMGIRFYRGSILNVQSPYCPLPPDCLINLPCFSDAFVTVSR